MKKRFDSMRDALPGEEILKRPISQEMLGGHAMLEYPVVVQGTVALHLRYPWRR